MKNTMKAKKTRRYLCLLITLILIFGSLALADEKISSSVHINVKPTAEPAEETTAESTEGPAEEAAAQSTEEPTAEPAEETTAEPTAEPAEETTAESTEEPAEETTAEPIEELTEEPADETTAEPTEGPAEETTPEPTAESTEAPVLDPVLEIETNGDPQLMYIGDTLVMEARISGMDDVPYSIRWQINTSGEWEDIPGTEGAMTYSVELTEENIGSYWRYTISTDDAE